MSHTIKIKTSNQEERIPTKKKSHLFNLESRKKTLEPNPNTHTIKIENLIKKLDHIQSKLKHLINNSQVQKQQKSSFQHEIKNKKVMDKQQP